MEDVIGPQTPGVWGGGDQRVMAISGILIIGELIARIKCQIIGTTPPIRHHVILQEQMINLRGIAPWAWILQLSSPWLSQIFRRILRIKGGDVLNFFRRLSLKFLGRIVEQISYRISTFRVRLRGLNLR